MKIRYDFVTNSSSSSYIISCSEILDKEALFEYVKEEYGRKGEGIKNYIVKGSEVKEECENVFYELYVDKKDIEKVENDKEYLFVYRDIENEPGGSAAMSFDVCHKSLNHLFSSTWSGFNGWLILRRIYIYEDKNRFCN